MAQRGRPARKGSTASKDAPVAPKEGKGTMGPPPDPVPPAIPALILEPEVDALALCLKTAAIKAGQIYRFYADTQKLGIQKHAPTPPLSLTSALGREVEKYDQLCDAIESQLLRAIAVLERDVAREERKIEDANRAALFAEEQSKPLSLSPTSSLVELPSQMESLPSSQIPTRESSAPHPSAPVPPTRRPSIFLSSLQRPMPPPKLDLSLINQRMTTDDSLFSGGLASPVTLAPRSARPMAPNELPDLMAFAADDIAVGAIDIDLTVPDETQSSTGLDAATNGVGVMLDSTLSASAEKPIVLNMTELFGDADSAMDETSAASLFPPATTTSGMGLVGADVDPKSIKDDVIDMDLFGSLSAVNEPHAGQDLFTPFGADPRHALGTDQLGGTSAAMDISSSMTAGTSTSMITPSPASLLASFEASANMSANEALSTTSASDNPFDFDLSTLSPSMFTTTPSQGLSFEELFNIDDQGSLDTTMGDSTT